METKKVIKTNVEDVKLAYLDKNDNYYEVECYDDLVDIKEKDRLETIFNIIDVTFGILIENIGEDLKDIWERLDEIEDK